MKIATTTDKYLHLIPWKTVLPGGLRSDVEVAVDPTEGLIVHVGTAGDMRAWLAAEKERGRDARAVKSGLLMPGITDAHMHPLLFPMLRAMNATSCQGMSKQQLFAAIENANTTHNEHDLPLLFTELDTSKVKDLTAVDLDHLTDNRDVAVVDASLHGCVVSSSLGSKLSKALVDRTSLAGYFRKDGSLSESYVLEALTLMQSHYPIETFETQMERDLQRTFSIGVTSVHDLLPLNLNSFHAALNVRKRWREANKGDFPITRFYMRPEQVRELGHQLADLEREGLFSESDLQDGVGIKLFADGSFGTHTALVSEEYLDHRGYGIPYDTADQMNNGLQLALRHGLKTVAVHAIGDAGIRRALDVAKLWIADGQPNASACRFRIEHYELPTKAILDETKDAGCWVVPQPNFLLDVSYADRLGDRVEWICPHQEILSRGIRMMFGTDGMPDSMLYAIYLATHANNKSQRIGFMEALEASTSSAARFEKDNRGEIAPGNKADLVEADPELLARLSPGDPDIARTPEVVNKTLSDIERMVKVTYKNGRQVYSRD